MRDRKLISKAVLTGLLINLMFVSEVWCLTSQQIAQEVFPSVVLLVMVDENSQPVSLGSGFFVRDNIVATNLHVIEGAVRGYAKIIGDKAIFNIAGTVGIDRDVDLVLLFIKGAKAPILPLGNSAQVRVGDEIYAVGNPQGLEGTFSKGMVSAVRSDGTDILFQVTAPISQGSSGGPIVNTEGKVIGVIIAQWLEGQNLNFAIPACYLDSLLSKTTAVKPLTLALKNQKPTFDSSDKGSVESITARLETFLTKYCRAYENKQLDKFSTFFTSDAVENGKPFRSYLQKYRQNFNKIDSIKYGIEVKRYSIHHTKRVIRFEGTFYIKARLIDRGKWLENIGSISMDLIESGESYLVKRLNYTSQSSKNVGEHPQWGHWKEIENKK